MRLTRVQYSQFRGESREWSISDLTLGPVNLLVGKNASGKSRTLAVLFGLGRLASGAQRLEYASGHYDVTFEHEGKNIRYVLEYKNKQVLREEFMENGRTLLTRSTGGMGSIYHAKEGKDIEFQSPVSDIAAAARRDSLQHPFLEPLGEWGLGVRKYLFGEQMGKNVVTLLVKDGPEPDPIDVNAVVSLFRKAEKKDPDFAKSVRLDMEEIGYPNEEVGVAPPSTIAFHSAFTATPATLFVKEVSLPCRTEQAEMSQGMFRALSIITLLNYAISMSRPSVMLVDDIGEGLDFDRSCKRIDLIRRKALESHVQLIMSTNDRFVMNKVPLEEWLVLHREGGTVHMKNYANSKEAFDEFKFTGLSNFDFFASDFLKEECLAHE